MPLCVSAKITEIVKPFLVFCISQSTSLNEGIFLLKTCKMKRLFVEGNAGRILLG